MFDARTRMITIINLACIPLDTYCIKKLIYRVSVKKVPLLIERFSVIPTKNSIKRGTFLWRPCTIYNIRLETNRTLDNPGQFEFC